MWLAKEAFEIIQRLCGREDKATTEIYVKQRRRETSDPKGAGGRTGKHGWNETVLHQHRQYLTMPGCVPFLPRP
jgi:hypothetical protein